MNEKIWTYIFFSVMYCSDPGHVDHSTRSLSDPKLLVGTTIQFSCNPGFILQGGATITCYGREPGTPVWTSRLPHCVCEYQKVCTVLTCKKEDDTWELVVFTDLEKIIVILFAISNLWAERVLWFMGNLSALWFQKPVIRIDSCARQ